MPIFSVEYESKSLKVDSVISNCASQSLKINCRRSLGWDGSSGTYAAPAFRMPNIATSKSKERCMDKATLQEGVMPTLCKARAN